METKYILIITERRVLVAGDFGLWGGGSKEMLVKGSKFAVIRITSSGDLIYSMMIMVNSTALYA